ncbi:hypothetical protein [Methanolobus sp.]|uniref:hypothetical protein n=1 Tax=Methanolobus sp. TaxID=1874737 RepID=UPI0025CF4874|nr:hypothetical protein [Methanolobus sp.]
MGSEICARTQAEDNPASPASDCADDGAGSLQGHEYNEECSGKEAEISKKSPYMGNASVSDSRHREMEEKLALFERELEELRVQVSEGFSEHGGSISSIHTELSKMSPQAEFRQLRRDFDVFSKRLRRIVKSEDSLSAETLDAAKVPPDVLEITYAKTLNDLYAAMLNIFGDRESSEIVENTRDKVRQFSAGVDFFRFENGIFLVRGLSDAVSSKLVSIKQIHATYIELFKILSQAVPNFSSQDFRSFVETGSREYTVQKVVSHDKSIEKISSRLPVITEELTNLTENMQFMAELQNNQLEDTRSHAEGIEEIKSQMKNITKAVNLHTKALRKLGKTLEEFRTLDNTATVSPFQEPPEALQSDLVSLKESMDLKVNRDEVLTISEAVASLRDEINITLEHMQQQVLQSIHDSEKIQDIHADILNVREELVRLRSENGSTRNTCTDEFSSGHIEQMVLEEIKDSGPVTLKQLENQISSRCGLDSEEISALVGQMEQAQLLLSFKKGRYTYFTLRELANV